MIEDPVQLLIVFLGIVLAAVLLDRRYAFARKLSPVLIILFSSALCSNTGLISRDAPFYGDMIGFTVPLAVCLILFTVQLKDLKRVGLPMAAAFVIACAGTFMGALVAGALLDPSLDAILPGSAWKLAGPFTGTYTGGSLNFFALWTGLEIESPDLLAAANAVDNLTLFPLFAIWIFAPDLLGRFYPGGGNRGRSPGPASRAASAAGSSAASAAGSPHAKRPAADPPVKTAPFRITDVTALTFLALVVVHLSGLVNDRFIAAHIRQFPTILIVTTLALILAQLRFVNRLEGASEMGNIAFYLFFCAVGAMIDLEKAVSLCPILFVYVMIMIGLHMLSVYGLGRLLRIDIRVLTIASAATKAGPAAVLALANVKGWKRLVLPGVAMGLLGYAVGNYLGFAAAYLMKFILGS
jgi:uncharacterized membrane protein